MARKQPSGTQSSAASPASTSAASSRLPSPRRSASASHAGGAASTSESNLASISYPIATPRSRSTIGWKAGRISAGSARTRAIAASQSVVATSIDGLYRRRSAEGLRRGRAAALAALAVGPGLRPVAAGGHVAPRGRPVLRPVVERPLALVLGTRLEALPGALRHRAVDDRDQPSERAVDARPDRGELRDAMLVEAHHELRALRGGVARAHAPRADRPPVVGEEQLADRLAHPLRLAHVLWAQSLRLGEQPAAREPR